MKISEVMTIAVQVGSPDDKLQKAAQRMADYDFDILPILVNNQLVEMLSDPDFTIRAVIKGLPPNEHFVR